MAKQKLDLYELHADEYITPKTPELVKTKPGKYLSVQGKGAPGGEEFTKQVGALYGVAFTIKFALKGAGEDYAVSKLEGLWWGTRAHGNFALEPQEKWNWKLLIRTPDFVTEKQLKDAIATLKKKGKGPEVGKVKLETIDEGLCVQMLHVGPYAEEGKTVRIMEEFVKEKDLKFHGLHHEIYLSDPRRVPAQRLKTILRMPVR